MLVLDAPVRDAQPTSREDLVTLLFLAVGVAVVAAIALLAVGRLGELPEVEPDRPPTLLPETRLVESDDVDAVRFAVGLRGYRMDEVDDVLDRLSADIAERDARIAELEAATAAPAPEASAGDPAPQDPSAPQ
jgi:DivIVA domain-containing protein